MFGGWEWTGDWNETAGLIEGRLLAREAEISQLRSEQAKDLRTLDRLQVDLADGDRGMADWVASHLDLSHQSAARLMAVARAEDPSVDEAMAAGRWGLDRASLLIRLAKAGASPELVSEAAAHYSLGRLYGLVLSLREVSSLAEQADFDSRFLVIQPNLDESVFRLWGSLHGVDGQTVDKALRQRAAGFGAAGFGAAGFGNLPDQTQGQLLADALTAIATDSLTGSSEQGESGRAVVIAEVFVDSALAAPSHGEAGVTTSSGLRVGPNTLSEILCAGKVRVVYTEGENGPLAITHSSESIPPPIRSFVLWRDQGSIEGCSSRHRLQPHHLRLKAQGGDHHPDNLITLCWWHHHVAIHQMGMTIDPTSPPHRRRLVSRRSHGPPPPTVSISVPAGHT
jgi:hypothetical protein